MRGKTVRRAAIGAYMALLLMCSLTLPALAYYDWGPVAVTLGDTDITVPQGQTVSVSAEVSPASSDQLPGCGMAQCPQTCGPGCVDEKGFCQCAGTTYQTYYAKVKISTSDTTVAKASYKAGVVSVFGSNPGSAVIKVTGSLRQYSDTTKEIKVTVIGAPLQTQAAEQTAAPPKAAQTYSPAITAPPSAKQSEAPSAPSPERVSPSPAAALPEATSSSEEALFSPPKDTTCSAPDGARAKTALVSLTGSEIAPASDFAAIMGQNISRTYQKKDESGNVLYSWTFDGKDITVPSQVNLAINDSAEAEGAIRKLIKNKDAKTFSFEQNGALPGKTTIYLRVSGTFQNSQTLKLSYYNSDTKKLELISDSVRVENGYASFTLDHCSDYVLIPVGGSVNWVVRVIIIAAVLVAGSLGAGITITRRKHLKELDGIGKDV